MADPTISDIKQLLPPECFEIHPARSFATLVRVLLMVALTQYLVWIIPSGLEYWWLKLPAMVLAGLALVGMFVLGHDCGHYAFSRTRWVNDVVGTLCHFPIMNGFFAWRLAHDFHHRHTQQRKMDPDWPELLYTPDEKVRFDQRLAVKWGVGSPLGIVLGFWVGMTKRAFFSVLIPQIRLNLGRTTRVYLHTLLSALGSFALIYGYAQWLGTQKFLEMYAGPALIATSFGALLTFLHHTHRGSYVFDVGHYEALRGQLLSTWNVRFPRWMEWLWLDINLHQVHHVAVRIPWYHLRQASQALKEKVPELCQEKRWSWSLMRECWRVTRLKKEREGVYRLAED